MTVESEVEALRDDVRGLRATLDSFIRTFNSDVMSRLATLEQWKISHESEDARAYAKIDSIAAGGNHYSGSADEREMKQAVAALVSDNDKTKGSLATLRMVGAIVMGVLTLAEIIHGFFTIRGR